MLKIIILNNSCNFSVEKIHIFKFSINNFSFSLKLILKNNNED